VTLWSIGGHRLLYSKPRDSLSTFACRVGAYSPGLSDADRAFGGTPPATSTLELRRRQLVHLTYKGWGEGGSLLGGIQHNGIAQEEPLTKRNITVAAVSVILVVSIGIVAYLRATSDPHADMLADRARNVIESWRGLDFERSVEHFNKQSKAGMTPKFLGTCWSRTLVLTCIINR
jgi:hypothetical protein